MLGGKHREGVEELEACLADVPDDVWTTRILTAAYLEKGDLDRAEELALVVPSSVKRMSPASTNSLPR